MKRGLSLCSAAIQRILRNVTNNQRKKFNYTQEIKQLFENHKIQLIQDKIDHLNDLKFTKMIQLVIMPSIRQKKKSTVSDGFTDEFYQIFTDKLAPISTNVFQEIKKKIVHFSNHFMKPANQKNIQY